MEVVTAFVVSCGGDVAEWKRRWELAVRAVADAEEAKAGRSAGNFLPRAVPDFTGRAAEVSEIVELMLGSSPVPVVAVSGMAGVGKTTLALHVAHRLAGCFPDGQLYLDLHGHSSRHAPLSPVAALEGLLRMTGVTGALPSSPDQLGGRWRAAIAGRKLLIVLDDAADRPSLEPLLPGSTECAVITTSRRHMTAIAGVHSVRLDVLPVAEAARLFGTIVGGRAAAEPQEVENAVGLCGGLPLAVRLAAARLRSRPAWTVRHLAGLLADQDRRLRLLSADDDGVTAVLNVSYTALRAAGQQMLRLLSLHPVRDFTAASAAALTGTSVAETADTLDELVDAAVLEQIAVDRYRLHDLVKLYTRSLIDQDAPAARDAAVSRLLDHYIEFAAAAVPGAICELGELPDQQPYHAQLRIERQNLVSCVVHAAETGRYRQCVALATALISYLIACGDLWREVVAVSEAAAVAAEKLADARGQASANLGGGMANMWLGHPADALQQLHRALCLTEIAQDSALRARILAQLSRCHQLLDHRQKAITCAESARDIARSCGESQLEVIALAGLGDALRACGRTDEALAVLGGGLRLARGIGYRRGEIAVLNVINGIDAVQGRYDVALEGCTQVQEILTRIGDAANQAINLANMGFLHARLGHLDEAVTALRRAIDILRRSGDVRAEASSLNNLASVLLQRHDYKGAAEHYLRARDLARETGSLGLDAEACNGLGMLASARGKHRTAIEEYLRALELAERAAVPRFQAQSHAGLADSYQAVGDREQARRHLERAIELFTDLGMPEAEQLLTRRATGQLPSPSKERAIDTGCSPQGGVTSG